MPRYLMRRKGKDVDYALLPKGVPRSKAHPSFRHHKIINAPSEKSALKKFLNLPKGSTITVKNRR